MGCATLQGMLGQWWRNLCIPSTILRKVVKIICFEASLFPFAAIYSGSQRQKGYYSIPSHWVLML